MGWHIHGTEQCCHNTPTQVLAHMVLTNSSLKEGNSESFAKKYVWIKSIEKKSYKYQKKFQFLWQLYLFKNYPIVA